MKRFLFLLFALLLLTGCHPDPDPEDRQVVLMYFAGNNSLSAEGSGDLKDIKESYLPATKETEKIVLVFYHFVDNYPRLVRLSRDKRGNLVEEIIKDYPFDTNSASAQTLSEVLLDAEKAWPAGHKGLILWSHGSGFLPEGYYVDPKESRKGDPVFLEPDPYADIVKAEESVKSFGEDHGTEMDIIEMRKVLSRTHYEFILFDACLMANVEVAYELRNVTDYLLFSPTEIISDGFPYEAMIQPILTLQPEAAMTSIARSYMSHYRALSGVYQSATITLVKCMKMDALASACRPIFSNHREQILTLDRSDIQPYFRYGKHWFYDLDDFVRRVATESELSAFASALNQAVIFKDTTPYVLDIPMKHYSGLSSYIPRPENTVLNNYYKTLAWNQAAGLVQ